MYIYVCRIPVSYTLPIQSESELLVDLRPGLSLPASPRRREPLWDVLALRIHPSRIVISRRPCFDSDSIAIACHTTKLSGSMPGGLPDSVVLLVLQVCVREWTSWLCRLTKARRFIKGGWNMARHGALRSEYRRRQSTTV